MAEVEIVVNGRRYPVRCDEGEEEHVAALGRYLDGKVAALAEALGQVGDARLAVMAGLVLGDELFEARKLAADAVPAADAAPPGPSPNQPDQALLAVALGQLALRIDQIASTLEQG